VLTGSLLDAGERGLVQALVGVAVIVVLLLLAAVFVPVAMVYGGTGAALYATSTFAWTALHPQATSTTEQVPTSNTSGASTGSRPVDVARGYLGVPYVFGGTNPAVGLDCSGLVQLVFRQLGVSLPRTAQQQFNATSPVARAELRPGDLVFFARTYSDPGAWITHVGIYIGNGQQINAPTEGQTVSIQPVFTGFWGAHFVGGGRVGASA